MQLFNGNFMKFYEIVCIVILGATTSIIDLPVNDIIGKVPDISIPETKVEVNVKPSTPPMDCTSGTCRPAQTNNYNYNSGPIRRFFRVR